MTQQDQVTQLQAIADALGSLADSLERRNFSLIETTTDPAVVRQAQQIIADFQKMAIIQEDPPRTGGFISLTTAKTINKAYTDEFPDSLTKPDRLPLVKDLTWRVSADKLRALLGFTRATNGMKTHRLRVVPGINLPRTPAEKPCFTFVFVAEDECGEIILGKDVPIEIRRAVGLVDAKGNVLDSDAVEEIDPCRPPCPL